jgi:hypothetical protein
MDNASLFEGIFSSISHRCECKNGPYDSVFIMILLILDDMIVVEIVCLLKVVVCHCGECDSMVVIVCHCLVVVCY